ncbi:hypothetical protein JL722_5128 [Aureococcus anophagefferens]|nr:hypothetical protein JL722_5128 [Aureococcus anophagefferens]
MAKALARKVHPDKRPGDAAAAADFHALKRAYDVLSDPARRKRYDRAGTVGDDDEGFEAAYERYRGVEISEEDIEAFESGYHDSAAERADVLAYCERHDGDVSRILEAIIGSADGDADRYVALLAKAFKDKELPKRFKKGFDASKTRVMTIAELEADAEELDSDDEEEEEEDDDDDGGRRRRGGEGRPRERERQDGFDAFAARWEETSKREAAQAKGKKKKKGKGGTDYAW